jgi:hypothetical protein
MTDIQITAILKSQELILNEVLAVRAEVEAIREANILLLKGLAQFPAGETPAGFLTKVREKSLRELEKRTKDRLLEIENLLGG